MSRRVLINTPTSVTELQEALDVLLSPTKGVQIKTRRWRLKFYKDCFVGKSSFRRDTSALLFQGSEAVDCLVTHFSNFSGRPVTREDAVTIGNALERVFV